MKKVKQFDFSLWVFYENISDKSNWELVVKNFKLAFFAALLISASSMSAAELKSDRKTNPELDPTASVVATLKVNEVPNNFKVAGKEVVEHTLGLFEVGPEKFDEFRGLQVEEDQKKLKTFLNLYTESENKTEKFDELGKVLIGLMNDHPNDKEARLDLMRKLIEFKPEGAFDDAFYIHYWVNRSFLFSKWNNSELFYLDFDAVRAGNLWNVKLEGELQVLTVDMLQERSENIMTDDRLDLNKMVTRMLEFAKIQRLLVLTSGIIGIESFNRTFTNPQLTLEGTTISQTAKAHGGSIATPLELFLHDFFHTIFSLNFLLLPKYNFVLDGFKALQKTGKLTDREEIAFFILMHEAPTLLSTATSLSELITALESQKTHYESFENDDPYGPDSPLKLLFLEEAESILSLSKKDPEVLNTKDGDELIRATGISANELQDLIHDECKKMVRDLLEKNKDALEQAKLENSRTVVLKVSKHDEEGRLTEIEQKFPSPKVVLDNLNDQKVLLGLIDPSFKGKKSPKEILIGVMDLLLEFLKKMHAVLSSSESEQLGEKVQH